MEIVIVDKVIPVRADGYIDVTIMCQITGKEFHGWYKLKGSKELIKIFQEESNNLNGTSAVLKPVLEIGYQHNHSYAHPFLAIQIAQWAEKRYAFHVSTQIMRLGLGDRTLIPEIEERAQELEKIKNTSDEMRQKIEAIESCLADKNNQVGLLESHISKLQLRDKLVNEIADSVASNPLVRIDTLSHEEQLIIMAHNTNVLLSRNTHLRPLNEIAIEMGYTINSSNQISFGRYISKWYENTKQTGRELKLGGCRNMKINIWWYKDTEDLRFAIRAFFRISKLYL